MNTMISLSINCVLTSDLTLLILLEAFICYFFSEDVQELSVGEFEKQNICIFIFPYIIILWTVFELNVINLDVIDE